MPFVTSIERSGFRKGIRTVIESVLRTRFGEAGLALMPEIKEIHDEQQLEAILLNALENAASPEEVRKFWTTSGS